MTTLEKNSTKLETMLLERTHKRQTFNCGVEPLNRYLKQYAFQNQVKHISKTFVTVHESNDAVIAFYTLATGQIRFQELPEGVKHPKYPISIVRLARLAVDLTHQKRGIGEFLFYDALQKIQMAAQFVGIFAVVVDTKDNATKAFYEQYGFIELQQTEQTLFLPISTLSALRQ